MYVDSIEEPQEPQGELPVFAHLRVVAEADGAGRRLPRRAVKGVDDDEPETTVYLVGGVVARLVHLVVLPKGIDEEGLHHVLLLHLARIDGVHQVGVVKHHLGRLLRERLPQWVDHVDQAGVGQVFDVVHHRGTARVDVDGQLAHVGRLGPIYGHLVEQPLDAGEVFQLYLLDEKDVYLGHHVHRLEKVLRIVATLLEKRIETMVQVVLEVFLGACLRKDRLDDVLMVGENLLKSVRAEVVARLKVEKLAEREATEIVTLDDAVEFGVLLLRRITLEPVNTMCRSG